MKQRILILLVLLMSGAMVLAADQSTKADGRAAAANELLVTVKMEKILADSTEQMVQLQIQQNPAIEPYREVMRRFLAKYMSWEGLKGDFVRIYAEEFTEQELRDLIAFYRTPTGIKFITKMPGLMSKGAQIGSQRVQQNAAELKEMMRMADEERRKKK